MCPGGADELVAVDQTLGDRLVGDVANGMASKRISGFACSATRSAIFTLAVEIRSPNLRTTVGRDVCVSQGARRPGGGYRRSARQVAGLDPFGSITTRVPTPSLARYCLLYTSPSPRD